MKNERSPPVSATVAEGRPRRNWLVRAPSPAVSLTYTAVIGLAAALFAWNPFRSAAAFLDGYVLVFLVPLLGAGFLTGPLAAALGGQLSVRRSALLGLTTSIFPLPLLGIWWGLGQFVPRELPSVGVVLLLTQAPVLWFRHMSLFGISKPEHARSLPPSLVQPLLVVAGVFALEGLTPVLAASAAAFLTLGFLCSALLLRAADRPLYREFGVSGVSMMRPLLDHVNDRDPEATEILERFFAGLSVPANLRVGVIGFFANGRPKATVVLPTVHPGPFAALGASDLPRKIAERLASNAGIVFVPHTPCTHDLDLPTQAAVERIADVTVGLVRSLDRATPSLSSALLAPRPGSLARAQQLGGAVVVVVTQAPEPTDDIDFAVIDRLFSRGATDSSPLIGVIDAHNSYEEDRGDVAYGSPVADRLANDVRDAVRVATESARMGVLRVGSAVSSWAHSVGRDGIGPEGIRVLAVETAGRRTAYVLIDGNNLVRGHRDRLISDLGELATDAEILTTDNHVVHEVDGGINPVGERYPYPELRDEVRATVRAAFADATPVEVRVASTELADVPVLGPGVTTRLLTSLRDTRSMFGNALLTTFLLLLASSLVVLAVLRG